MAKQYKIEAVISIDEDIDLDLSSIKKVEEYVKDSFIDFYTSVDSLEVTPV